MNILNKVTWKAMWQNKTRTLVTIVGIVLSAALFCMITTVGTSILSYLIELQIAIGGDYHVSATIVSKEEAEEIRAHEGIASAAQADILGVVNLYGYEMGSNSAMIKACNSQYFATMPGFDHIDGRLPQNSSELVIGEYLLHTMEAKGYPITIGSEVTLPVTPVVEAMEQGDSSASDFTVTGTIVGILPAEYDIVLSHEKGAYSHIYMGLDESTPAPVYVDLFLKAAAPHRALRLAQAVGGQANYSLLQYYGTAKAGNVTVLILAIMAAVIAVVLVATVSMVSNAFSISVSHRTREFGLLSSVGATKKQIRSCIRSEAGLLCASAIPPGLLIGFFAAKALLTSSADTVESMLAVYRTGVTLKAVADPIALLGATAVSMAAVFLSAWLPAFRASKISPITAIRRETEYRPDRKLQKTARKWWKPSKVSGNMAYKYYRVNRKKYRPIVAALGISVVIFLSASAVSSSLRFVSDAFDAENFDFHVFIINKDSALLEQIRSHESVAQSVLYRNDGVYAIIPADAASQQRQDAFAREGWEGQPVEDAWRTSTASVYYLEDDAFCAFLRERGVDPEPYFDRETPTAVALYQQWEYTQEDEDGHYDWVSVTFPPFRDDVTALSFVSEAPDAEEYVAAQIKAQGYQDVIIDEKEFDTLPDGRIVFRAYAQGCVIKQHGGGIGEVVAQGDKQVFTFLAAQQIDAQGQSVTCYYPYDEATGTVGATAVAQCSGAVRSICIGAQLDGVPFGISGDAGSATQLTLIRPLSMAEDQTDLPALSIRTNNYPATKSYLDSLADAGGVLVYNDYLAEQYQTRQVSGLIELFAVTFVVVMTLISVANIFNIVSTNIFLRRRDIGMLRSIGMSGRGVVSMTVREYMSCGLYSLCWSLPVGLLLMGSVKILLANVINGGMQIPWGTVGGAIAGVLPVVGSSVIYALIRIRNDDPIEAIRTENI